MLPNPLRDRFGFTAHLEFYATEELHLLLERSAKKLDIDHETEALNLIASRSRGTPRIANRLLRRVRDYALVNGHKTLDSDCVNAALALYEVDELGLDRMDRLILDLLTSRFASRPVGLTTLAVAVGEEADTIESVVEPYLVRAGLISRTHRGREATAEAYKHMKRTAPNDSGPTLLDL
jgi:Holliday junction DNA helicase RuvB